MMGNFIKNGFKNQKLEVFSTIEEYSKQEFFFYR